MVKPFNPAEVVARIEAVLRRANVSAENSYQKPIRTSLNDLSGRFLWKSPLKGNRHAGSDDNRVQVADLYGQKPEKSVLA